MQNKNNDSKNFIIQSYQQVEWNNTLFQSDENIIVDVQPYAIFNWYIQLQNEHQNKQIQYKIVVHEHAKVQIFVVNIASQNIDIDLQIILQGNSAQADVYGIYALNGIQKMHIKTEQIHQGIDTKSFVLVKGMVNNAVQAMIHSLIKILPGAHNADGVQENKNIILSSSAKVQAQPSIEVLQHDVQCAHATATSQFDQKHAWYLQSKGLDAIQTKQLLIQSFFELVVSKFENKKQIMELICQKMI